MDLFLVRHGEAAASWSESSDPGLSPRGREQAAAVASTLGGTLSADVELLSSPLARARETALPLAAELGAEVTLAADFREIPSPVPLPERQSWLRQFMRESWPGQPPELHAWRDLACERLQRRERPAVVFTHFLLINAVVGRLLEREDTLCFWPDNGSITHLVLRDGRLQLVELGSEMNTVVN